MYLPSASCIIPFRCRRVFHKVRHKVSSLYAAQGSPGLHQSVAESCFKQTIERCVSQLEVSRSALGAARHWSMKYYKKGREVSEEADRILQQLYSAKLEWIFENDNLNQKCRKTVIYNFPCVEKLFN